MRSTGWPPRWRPSTRSPTPDAALAELVRVHLGAYGPLTRADLAFFFGARLGDVDAAVAALGDEVTRLIGPDDQPMLDLAEPPSRR